MGGIKKWIKLMPCYEPDTNHPSYRHAHEMEKLANRNARIACYALTKLEELGVKIEDPEAKEWWETHKLFDQLNKHKKI